MILKLIIVLITLLSVYFLLSSDQNWLKKATNLFIAMFALGYRAFYVTNEFALHPIDVFLFLFWLRISISKINLQIPKIVYFLVLFSVFAFFIGLISDYSVELASTEFKGFIIIYFIFSLICAIKEYNIDFDVILKGYTFSIGVVCFFGLIEYFFPSLIVYINALYNIEMSSSISENTDNFLRANFTNWGAATVGHIILLGIPFLFYLRKYKPYFQKNYVFLLFVFLELTSIYATGNRADWIAIIMMLLFYLFIYKSFSNRVFIYLVFVLIGIFLLPVLANLLPDSAIARFISGLTAIGGQADEALDSSGYQRQQRIEFAWKVLFDNPFGAGFGAAGWVHSDFLQFAANTGWIGGFLFIYFYFLIQVKSYRTTQSKFISVKDRDLLMVLIISNIGVGFNFMINGIYNLPQTGAPYFLLMALNYYANKRIEENLKLKQLQIYEVNNSITSI